ncbi:aminotransferase class V-fold PLP-dependent enzyme [Chondromyces crocatus]|uniref:Cysteine desulfurase n=1 Tax=Chondromyces crocatus TaxID=52 RepID=A0A0K1E7V9_CHOCO|nr:aminotransferase class V-fold PLP-dependent enzyme [Chondromyces crocatus]AKT36767.1 cysteine desulfurase [Chondromyces crocatus]
MRHNAEIAPPPKYTARLGDRSLFPHLAPLVFLNHAGISAPSQPVRQAVIAYLDDYAKHGSGAYPRWHAQRLRLREKLGRLVGASAADIGFVQSTTAGITALALCHPWREGDRIVLFTGEFPANVTPWLRAAEQFRLEPVFLPLDGFLSPDGDGLARLEAELLRGVGVVAVSAVQFQTGLRMPLAEIGALCRAHGAALAVDAVQACGAVPVDVHAAQIDYLACGSHKWLMGLEGCGFIYIRPERLAALRLTVAGWLSHEDAVSFLFEGPDRLRYDRPIRRRTDFVEGGNVNAGGLAGLEAALDLIVQIGVERIHEHANAFNDVLEPALVERGFKSLRAADPSRRSATLSALPPPDVAIPLLRAELDALGITCATPDGALRFSPHWPNALDEAEQVVYSLDEALTRVRSR